jgi:hypothetical protein
MAKIFFHIGLPKSASSFIASKIFTKLKDYECYGGRYDEIKNRIKKDFLGQKSQNIDNIKKKLITENCIISDESFVVDLDKDPMFYLNEDKIIKYIKKNFPNAKIILILREQSSIIKSWLLQKNEEKKKEFRINEIINFDSLDYYKLITNFKKNFDTNFQYFYYEELIHSPLEFEEKLLKFIDTSLKQKIDYSVKMNVGVKNIDKKFFFKILKKVEFFFLLIYLILRKIPFLKKFSNKFKIFFLMHPLHARYKDNLKNTEKIDIDISHIELNDIKKNNFKLHFDNEKIKNIYIK